jgi:hypothetical protein
MAQLSKYSRKDLRGVAREAYRELKPEQYENEVDLSRSHLNLNMNPNIEWVPLESKDCSEKLIRAVDDRVDEIVRETMDGKYPKNEVHFGSWVVTCPENLPQNPKFDRRLNAINFLAYAYDFCQERYGEKNIIDGIIHCDETHEHITIIGVPQCVSRKSGKPTISAASLYQRQELQDFHKDLDKYMENIYGVKNLIVRPEEERSRDPKNLSLREYKLLKAQAGNNQEFADLTKGAVRKADKIVSVAQKKADAIVAEAERKAAEILAQARAQTRALPQMPNQPQQGGYERTYA